MRGYNIDIIYTITGTAGSCYCMGMAVFNVPQASLYPNRVRQ